MTSKITECSKSQRTRTYNSVFRMLRIQWVEKSFDSNKLIGVCIPQGGHFSRKLLDGIGIDVQSRSERLIVDSSGEMDGAHTTEDTLKIVECSVQCLKVDMVEHKLASIAAFKKRQIFGLQYIGTKLSLLSTSMLNKDRWGCVLVRSAVVPRSWQDRRNWLKVFELLIKLDMLLDEQEELSERILEENTSGNVSEEESIRSMYNQDYKE